MTPAPWFVGIDVSKAQLDIALRPEGQFVVPNDETGHTHVVERLRTFPVALIVLEATGGLELLLIGALVASGLPVVVANVPLSLLMVEPNGLIISIHRGDVAVCHSCSLSVSGVAGRTSGPRVGGSSPSGRTTPSAEADG